MVDQAEELRKLAESKIAAESGAALDHVGVAAALLLTDLHATGLAHGITPEDWAWVTALPRACWDASLALDLRQQMAAERALRMGEDPRVTPPGSVHQLRNEPRPCASSSYRVQPPSQGRRGPSR